jgi:glyoxylase-like metal-dependent hydrolase (beta-lactamase superfamily II)
MGRAAAWFLRFRTTDRLSDPVLYVDGDSLAPYGVAARVLHGAGHSSGSLAVLTDAGDLICGDVLENRRGPAMGSIVDGPVALRATVERLRSLTTGTVYPGHGEPFRMADLAWPPASG